VKIDAPLLFFHGETDSLALPAEALRNYAAARGPKWIVWFEHCGHSQGRLEFPDRYHEALLGFFEENGLLQPKGLGTEAPFAAGLRSGFAD
jgi:pimeloyl-ACP methyl ester carboxylesterase